MKIGKKDKELIIDAVYYYLNEASHDNEDGIAGLWCVDKKLAKKYSVLLNKIKRA